jgi:2'-5' RNA ligase
MRAFIALELPKQSRAELVSLIDRLKLQRQPNLNWVSPENLHITFQFLGDISPAHLEDISQIMGNCCQGLIAPAFYQPLLQLVPAGKPRVLWVHYSCEQPELNKAHRQLCRQISELGYNLVRKPQVYHVTLARIKTVLKAAFIENVLKSRIADEQFSSPRITLYESILKPRGPEYNPLYSINF